jgi:hypothetical protein
MGNKASRGEAPPRPYTVELQVVGGTAQPGNVE